MAKTAKTTMKDLAETLERVQAQLSGALRAGGAAGSGRSEAASRRRPTVPVPAGAGNGAAPAPRETEEIDEEELLAISAAVAAYLGERVRIQTDSIAQLARVGTAGPRVDPGVPLLAQLGGAVKLNITIDGKTYEVEVEAVEPNGAIAAGARHSRRVRGVRVPAAPAPAPAPPATINR